MPAEFVSGNIFIRPHNLNKGDMIDGHQHNFDHTSFCIRGRVRVEARYVYRTFECAQCKRVWETRVDKDEKCPSCESVSYDKIGRDREEFLADRELEPSEWVLIRKHVDHKITALEDGTIFMCVYSHNTPQGTISQVHDGWMGSYT